MWSKGGDRPAMQSDLQQHTAKLPVVFLALVGIGLLAEAIVSLVAVLGILDIQAHWMHVAIEVLIVATIGTASAKLALDGIERHRRRQEEAVLGGLPAAVCVFDREGRLITTSCPATAALTTGKTWSERLAEARRSAAPVRFEEVTDGGSREVTIQPILDENGLVARMIAWSESIVESRRAAALETLKDQLDRRVRDDPDTTALLEFVCAELVRIVPVTLCWVGRKEASGAVGIAACAGLKGDCRQELTRSESRWDETVPGKGPVGVAFRSGKVQVFKCNPQGVQPWHKSARRWGAKSILCLPLHLQGAVDGVLTLYGADADLFDDDSLVSRLDAVAGRLAGALLVGSLRQRVSLMETGLGLAGNGIVITDPNGVIEWANAAFLRISGFATAEVLGQTPRILKSGQHDSAFYQGLWQTILNGQVWEGDTIERRKDGGLFVVHQTITPVRDLHGRIGHFVAVMEDVTAQRETEEKLHRMAQYDGLTDLPNRALFFDRLTHGITVSKRNHQGLGLLYLDLDRFKPVNESLGHRVGDALLRAVASRLRHCVRESDTVSRISGDEFTVTLTQISIRSDAARVSDKILDALAAPFEIEGHEIRIGVSIGIALFPQDGDSAEMLITRADAALNVVKMGSRNGYRFASA